jgi:hypothetical protein
MSASPQQHAQETLNETTPVAQSGGTDSSAPKSGEEGKVQERIVEEVHKEHPDVSEEKKAGTTTSQTIGQVGETAVDADEKTGVNHAGTADQDEQRNVVKENVGSTDTDNIAEKDVQAETVQPSTSDEPVASNVSADPSPAVSLTALRPLSPSSRTSTPPLTATSTAPAAKKFSSINVNKKFLSKTGSPSPSGPAGPTKLNPSAGKSLRN